ncbi:MAG: hypothetical protein GDA68_16940 [Nitrospira sp. CR2.1]|nr:hypothetical protein [Nitrospira sp. CR2.1]
MINIEYKRLFEVRFLHDYYLYGTEPGNGGSVKSFFAMSAENQTTRLDELVRSGRYDMRKDLDLLVGANDEQLFRNHRMKLVRTATGFFVGMQVKRVVANGGEIRFQPEILPPVDTYVTIGLSIANPFFGAISNLRLDQDVDNIYYFTNGDARDDLSLAAPIAQLVPGQRYRMGDLALVGGSVKQAVADNNGSASFWSTVAGKGLVNQGDRSLSPREEWYRNWRATVRLRSEHPVGVLRIALMSKNGRLTPIDENGLLTARFNSASRTAYPIFEVRFLSRYTYWRYRKRSGFGEREIETIMNGAGSILERHGKEFVTKNPRPLTRERSAWSEASIRLQDAQPGAIKAEGGKIFSDVEFNELNPVPKEG